MTGQDATEAWASSGLMALTGNPEDPPVAGPGDPAGSLREAGACFERLSEAAGRPVRLDWPALAGERAALLGLRRRGTWSPNGSCRMLRAADGWLALNLPRAEDFELVPAWLGSDPTWAGAVRAVEHSPVDDLVADAVPLGLAVAAVPETGRPVLGVEMVAMAASSTPRTVEGAVVVDLSALWAGPLAASLLTAAGCRVIKVESTRRPDGARAGHRGFFDLLNGGKQSVALDFESPDGRAALAALVSRADVVVESSRPRALAHLGLGPDSEGVRAGQVWVSITGHGREGVGRDRAAYGDDAAVAGGMVAWADDTPMFCGDAVADPLAGVHGAVAALGALASGWSGTIDVVLRDIAAECVGRTATAVTTSTPAAPPRARQVTQRAPPLGQHTDAVLADLR